MKKDPDCLQKAPGLFYRYNGDTFSLLLRHKKPPLQIPKKDSRDGFLDTNLSSKNPQATVWLAFHRCHQPLG